MSGDLDGQIRLEAVIRGHVQGVGFRYFVRRRAQGMGLTGWVANEEDGSVRCVAEGPPGSIDELEALLRRGPASARVTDVEVRRAAASGGFDQFGVRARGHWGD